MEYCSLYLKAAGPQKSSIIFMSGTAGLSARHLIKTPQMYNPTTDYVHNMSAPDNNTSSKAFMQVIHRRDAAVKTRKQNPAIEVI